MNVDDFEAADRAYWQRFYPERPDMGALLRHAERFGSEGVYETAEAYGYPLPELLQLDSELTRIDTERKKRFHDVPTRKRPGAADKEKAVLYLSAEGIADQRIAKQLGYARVQTVSDIRMRAERRARVEEAT